MYRERLKAILTPAERKIFSRLTSPSKIQNFLDTLPINFELSGETYMSPRRTLRGKTAHCFEGALVAAAALAYHGQKPLLMDLRTTHPYEDHVVALFSAEGGSASGGRKLWGAISKTNHVILRYREPVYRSVRELAMSYFHEYVESDGKKSLREYSTAFDLSRYAPAKWVTAEENLQWLVDALDASHHSPIAPEKNMRRLRRAAPIEIRAGNLVEWKVPRGFKGSSTD
jgi:hypothetical protein